MIERGTCVMRFSTFLSAVMNGLEPFPQEEAIGGSVLAEIVGAYEAGLEPADCISLIVSDWQAPAARPAS
jgi:hypothetical protein